MDEAVLLEMVASVPAAAVEMLGSLPLAFWLCVAFLAVAATLTRVLDG
jgi:hypothetical protein